MNTSIILMGVGGVAFIGYLVWLIIRIINWDSKIPPIIGMLLCVVMIVCGLSTTERAKAVVNTVEKFISQEKEIIAEDAPKEIGEDIEDGENEKVPGNEENKD